MEGVKLAALPLAASQLGPRLGWEVRRAVRRAGIPALAGAAAMLLAALALWQAHQLGVQRTALDAQLLATRMAKPVVVPSAAADSARKLAAFYAYLPAHETIPEQLKTLVAIAARSGVTLAKADYKAQVEDGAGFMRYQVTLPIKADYAKVQAFIVGALHGMPTLTLEAVAFKREQIESGEVEARVQFNLLVRVPLAKGARQ